MNITVSLRSLLRNETNLSSWRQISPPSFADKMSFDKQSDTFWYDRGKTNAFIRWVVPEKTLHIRFFNKDGEKREDLPKIDKKVRELRNNKYIISPVERSLKYYRGEIHITSQK